MKRINSSTAVIDKFGIGKNGFTAGNVQTGVKATALTPLWCEAIQEELMAVVEGEGLTPSSSDLTQLYTAIKLLGKKLSPPGSVIYFASTSAPTGWIKCNGAAISRTTYAALFSAIGTTFGIGDGATTFNVPDLRGEHIRGFDDGRGVDSGRILGSWQRGTAIAGKDDLGSSSIFFFGDGSSVSRDPADGTSSTVYGELTVATTTTTNYGMARVRNIALLACIKY